MLTQSQLNTGLIGKLICEPLFAMFADFAWLVPIIVTLIGVIFICEANEPTIIVAMSMSACCYLLLFTTIFELGTVGKALSNIVSWIFGDFASAVVYGLFGILTFAMLGVSSQDIAFQAGRFCGCAGHVVVCFYRAVARLWSLIWDMRLPHPSQFFGTDEDGAPHRAPAIPLPSSISFRRSEPVVGAVFVDAAAPAHHAATQPQMSYRLPHLSLFNEPVPLRGTIENKAQLIEDTLASFHVGVTVTNKTVGASVTRYELMPDKGVTVDKISKRANDLALALAARSVRVLAPIPGKSVVGIEIPNATPSIVTIREILETIPVGDNSLTIALGKDVTGKPITADLREMPHLLVAGATGAGKSVCLNNIVASLLVSSTPEHVQMLFIDPKRVELSVYNGIPHLVRPVITDPGQAASALQEMSREMDARYKTFEQNGLRNIEEYNARFIDQKLPYLVILIDELYDLMQTAGKAVESVICRLASLARATGIHVIVATQRPTVDVITGLIKANIPSRIAFAVASQVDSRTILDATGAELLLGRGDMLFKPIDAMKAMRLQGALITSEETKRLVTYWSSQALPGNKITVEPTAHEQKLIDPLAYEASRFVIDMGYASTIKIKEHFRLGHQRAARIMDILFEHGVVGPHEGKKPRRVLIAADELERVFNGKSVQCSAA